jgi:uncharacterized membrane protein
MKFKDMPKLPLVLIAVMFVVGAVTYPYLPAQIPTHWGANGQIDAWSAKSAGSVFFAPLMALAIYALLWLAPYLDPKRANLLRSRQVYSIVIELMTALFTVIFVGTLLAATNHPFPMASVIQVGVGVLFIVLGNYVGRVKRNWTMGVRYSWTLSDDTVWTKTNRLGGRLFVGAGALAVLGAFLPPVVGIALILVPALLIVPITYFYAMTLYRRLHPDEVGEPPSPKTFDGSEQG